MTGKKYSPSNPLHPRMGLRRAVVLAGILLSASLPVAASLPTEPYSPAPVEIEGGFWDSGFGESVALDGALLAVGTDGHNGAAESGGAVNVFERQGDAWVHEATLFSSEAEPLEMLGKAVELDGEVLVAAGSTFNLRDAQVSVFRRGVGDWVEEAVLRSPVDGRNAFGWSIALDDDVLAVGAPSDDDPGNGAGAVYLYERGLEGWQLVEKLHAADPPEFFDFFGASVALDGDRLVVGATSADSRGAVYVFDRGGGSWTQSAKLVAPGSNHWQFGYDVAVEGDRLVVGVPESPAGHAVVYVRSEGEWVLEAVFRSSGAGWRFGVSVDFEGDRLVVGEEQLVRSGLHPPGVGSPAGQGVVHVYRLADEGGWYRESVLRSPEVLRRGDAFGRDVALSEGLLAVAAPGSKAVFLFSPMDASVPSLTSGAVGGLEG